SCDRHSFRGVGSGEWGVGSGEKEHINLLLPHSPFPTPYSLFTLLFFPNIWPPRAKTVHAATHPSSHRRPTSVPLRSPQCDETRISFRPAYAIRARFCDQCGIR